MSLPKILGFILHPVVLAIPGVFLIVLSATANISDSLYWTLISLIFSGLLIVFVALGVKLKIFNNLDVSNRKQRVILYPFAILIVVIFAFVVHYKNGPDPLTWASIFFIITLMILDLINMKIKASVHVASVASLVTGVILLYGGISYLLILLIPVSAWARVKQQRHSLKEAAVGAVCGIAFTLIGVFVVQLLVK